MLFPGAPAPSYIPTNGEPGFQFLHILANASSFLFLFLFCLAAVLVGTRWYRIVVFHVHYPMLSDGEHPGHSLTWS